MKKFHHKIINSKGQTLVEFALMLSFFFFIIFAVVGISFFMVEERLGYYAAFMASRSYQVYGNQAEDSNLVANSSLTKKYQSVFYTILADSYPYIATQKTKFSIYPDAYIKQSQGPSFSTEFPSYNTMLKYYEIDPATFPEVKLATDNITSGITATPTFGLMKAKFPVGWWFLKDLGISNLDQHEIFVPYRLEARLNAHTQ